MVELIWKGKHYSFFQNRECEFFPCHKGVDVEKFNCLFCYCPLYALGKDCGGNPSYTKNNIKNCSECIRPHEMDNYGIIIEKCKEITDSMKEDNHSL